MEYWYNLHHLYAILLIQRKRDKMSANVSTFEVHFLCGGERRVTKVRAGTASQAAQSVRDAFEGQNSVLIRDVLDIDGNQAPDFTDFNEV